MDISDAPSSATLYAEAIFAQKPDYLPALLELHRLEVRATEDLHKGLLEEHIMIHRVENLHGDHLQLLSLMMVQRVYHIALHAISPRLCTHIA